MWNNISYNYKNRHLTEDSTDPSNSPISFKIKWVTDRFLVMPENIFTTDTDLCVGSLGQTVTAGWQIFMSRQILLKQELTVRNREKPAWLHKNSSVFEQLYLSSCFGRLSEESAEQTAFLLKRAENMVKQTTTSPLQFQKQHLLPAEFQIFFSRGMK